MTRGINKENLKKYRDAFESNKAYEIVSNAVQRNGVLESAFNTREAQKLINVFNVEVKDMPSVTNQKKSGRCWMFASYNVIRPILCEKLNQKDFEPSESYLMFYDKLEKSDMKLSTAIDFIDEATDSRYVDAIYHLGGNFDGGYWHYFRDLVKKYGIVPKTVMGETQPSSNSAEMDTVLEMLLAKDLDTLRREYKNGKTKEELFEIKDEMLSEVYRVLAICIGTPVETFKYEYIDNDKEYVCIESDPLTFYEKYCGVDLDDYVCCISHKDENYPYYQKYDNKFAHNMYSQDYSVYNIPLDEMKSYAITALKENEPCWFACDVRAYEAKVEGLLSTKVVTIDELFDIDLDFDKFQKVVTKSSFWNHAMTFTGVNLDENDKADRWKIQNSWGTENIGDKGIFVCSDEWFDKYVYMVLVNKKYLSEEALKGLENETKVLEPWDTVA